ncbi:helix-turn-helix domain-containing protein [Chryseobacterium bernardetii]|uniref:Helix-turn-helix domain-containing protein n=1 Tax=Chryseobacterium bernardetii TaxID=1241978 RepID=A0A3G6T9W1_9FLAO|nr:AraC family transcriptional regulator [Chryseobacterium bernardetii]AZB24679.1 helix-turn-helix domain-containing protein [Chryseobacterium bernardetii]
MMRVKAFFLFIFFSNLLYTQNKISDSLKTYSYKELKNKFYTYYENIKIEQSKVIAQYYLQKAKKEQNTVQIADAYVLIHFNENFSNAIKYLDSAATITKNLKGTIYPSQTYLMKGNLYYKHDNLKYALDNYILGLQHSKAQKDKKQIAYANMNIAYLNSYMGKNADAAKTFRYYLYNGDDITDESQHNQMRISLIYCYIELNKLDSANILINEGLKTPLVSENKYVHNQYIYYLGAYYLKQKKYDVALKNFLTAYQYFSGIPDHNVTYTLLNIGKSYEGLKDKEKAVKNYAKMDSIIAKSSYTFPELRDVYTFLIDYYKENNNKEKQLYYIERFLKVDQKLDEQFKYLSTEIPRKYDTPNLLQEKENIIEELKFRKKVLYISLGILLLILLFIIYLYYRSKKTEKEQRKIAQDLISLVEKRNIEEKNAEEKNKANDIEIAPKAIPEQEEQNDKTSKTISEEVTQFILQELRIFESKELFLKKGITLASLAKNIKTNTAYLSEIINTHKGKNFAAYLNDLRIDFALNRLVKDKKFRSYKLSVIAEELGYNNEQAFSLAFKKKTGTTLSMYIKEIDNLSDF